ncbi:MBOAT family protein [uncultured Subdoligranulum sp.]|uniref:MBOAT family O-acyltransferase n=1 Tax=uncultured Subdoligranulum sp. TaxID=512298 RepID=UPI0026079506|nr:MBOAT family O-acyltransferase [uncultured Subdoligranulum sp.]
MAYNSFPYLCIFLPLCWVAWAVLPHRYRPAALLGGSLVFYWLTAGTYTVWLLLAAALTWALGLGLGRLQQLQEAALPGLDKPARKEAKHQFAALQRGMVTAGVIGLLGLLIWLKYLPFLVRTLNSALSLLPFAWQVAAPSFVQPLGLSFFTLMALSYLFDVRRGTTQPADHYWQVLLYLSFWPHVVEGPFDRWAQISPALLNPPKPNYRAFTFGVQRILWGMMKKLIIADRANMYVKAVFDNWPSYSGSAVVVATLLYTLQLYAEFSGCMDMVLGAAECFGVPLAENFRQPFFARSVSEFWRRWHITLGAWLREYLFQPAIVSKPMMRFGKWCRTRFGAALGRSLPVWAGLLLTWLAIGLWHGAGWLYVVYGLYYFLLQWLGEVAEPTLLRLCPSLPQWRTRRWYKLWQTLRTFVLVNFGMLLFRSNGTRAALEMLASLRRPYEGSLLIKLDAQDLWVLVIGALVLLAVDLLHERGIAIRESIARRPLPLRWAIYCGGMLAVMIFGAYGDNYDPAAFIYAQF